MEHISKTHLKDLMKLKQKKYRDISGTVLVEGVRLIKQLVENNIQILELITTDPNLNEQQYPAKKCVLVENWQMEKLSSTLNPQKTSAVIPIEFPPLVKDEFLIYLEDIQEPGNLGAIFRTALAAGIDGIVLSPDCCELSNPKVIRSSLGAVFSLPSKVKPISWLIKQEATIISTTSHQAEDIFDVSMPNGKKILVLGSEAHGISDEIIASSTYKVKIPISEKIESLNVAVAAGICIYHFIHAE